MRILFLAFISLFILLGCVSEGSTNSTETTLAQSTTTLAAATTSTATSTTTTTDNFGFTTTTSDTTTTSSTTTTTYASVTREFRVSAADAGFVPSRIEVNESDTIVLYVTALEDNYTIAIPSSSVYELLQRGVAMKIVTGATRVGEFEFYCAVDCGQNHSTRMRGTIIVHPRPN